MISRHARGPCRRARSHVAVSRQMVGVLTASDLRHQRPQAARLADARLLRADPGDALCSQQSRRKPLSVIAASYHLPFAAADRLENFPVETSAPLMALSAWIRRQSRSISAARLARSVRQAILTGLRVTLRDRPHHSFSSVRQRARNALLRGGGRRGCRSRALLNAGSDPN